MREWRVDDWADGSNTDDAKDRLKALIRATMTPRNRYSTSLLLVSWEEITLHAVIKDLDIQSEVDSFANVEVVCLTKDEMDGLVEPVLERLISEAKPKERVYLDIEGGRTGLMTAFTADDSDVRSAFYAKLVETARGRAADMQAIRCQRAKCNGYGRGGLGCPRRIVEDFQTGHQGRLVGS
jgi:hypothetical protein